MPLTKKTFGLICSLAIFPGIAPVLSADQALLSSDAHPSMAFDDAYHHFGHPIRRAAVIGAGPSGLQHAAALLEHGIQVRLFDRSPNPGGNWQYTPLPPIPATFPDKPLEIAAYVPDIPHKLPEAHIIKDGDGGISNECRWREHWNPSPVWESLHTNSPSFLTDLPGMSYPADSEWHVSHHAVRRHVRQYASAHGLNANDEESSNVTSYSTRVERIEKIGHTWSLTLRKFERLPRHGTSGFGDILVSWWVEVFDAVVVSTTGNDSPHVPPIQNINGWGIAFPGQMYHSREYRNPSDVRGKNVLIIGGSVSAAEIARDIQAYVRSFSISTRSHKRDPEEILRPPPILRLPRNITQIPEIKTFSSFSSLRHTKLSDATITLLNGTVVGGFDQIILATGYRRSNPFLYGFHNSTVEEDHVPDCEVPPIITTGSGVRSIHWTGVYIPNPTLAFSTVRPWTQGRLQALGIAKIWAGKARLPTVERLWKEYYVPGLPSLTSEQEGDRRFVAWLNGESLEFGGRFVQNTITPELYEPIAWWGKVAYDQQVFPTIPFVDEENKPRKDWEHYAQAAYYDDDW